MKKALSILFFILTIPFWIGGLLTFILAEVVLYLCVGVMALSEHGFKNLIKTLRNRKEEE